MIVTMPVVFEAHVIPKGARNLGWKTFLHRAEFEIAEATDNEAPVAIRNIRISRDEASNTRWHDGRHFALDSAAGEFDPLQWPVNLMRQRGLSRAWDQLLHATRRQGVVGRAEIERDQFETVRSCSSSTLEDDLARMRDFCKDLLLVDGRLYRAVATPAYYVSKVTDILHVGQSLGCRAVAAWAYYQRPTDVFRMDRVDDMMAHIAEHYGELEHEPEYVEVLIPESCSFDDESASIELSASVCLEHLRQRLPELSERQGISWFRLRSATEQAVSDRKGEDIAEAMSEFASACEPDAQTDWKVHNILSDAAAVARRAIGRWQVRPLELPPDALRP